MTYFDLEIKILTIFELTNWKIVIWKEPTIKIMTNFDNFFTQKLKNFDVERTNNQNYDQFRPWNQNFGNFLLINWKILIWKEPNNKIMTNFDLETNILTIV